MANEDTDDTPIIAHLPGGIELRAAEYETRTNHGADGKFIGFEKFAHRACWR